MSKDDKDLDDLDLDVDLAGLDFVYDLDLVDLGLD